MSNRADVPTTRRKARGKQWRTRRFEAHKGVCVICKHAIDVPKDRWIAEHIIPLGLGGKDEDENIGPAHETCAAAKTKLDIAAITKAKNVKAKYIGAKQARARPISSPGFPKPPKTPKPVTKASLPFKAFYESRSPNYEQSAEGSE